MTNTWDVQHAAERASREAFNLSLDESLQKVFQEGVKRGKFEARLVHTNMKGWWKATIVPRTVPFKFDNLSVSAYFINHSDASDFIDHGRIGFIDQVE